MCEITEIIKDAGLLVAGAAISGIIGILTGRQSRRDDVEQGYVISMRRLKDEASKTSRDRSGREFFRSTIDRVEDAVLRLLAVGPRDRSRQLFALWDEYRAISDGRLTPENEGGSDALAAQIDGSPPPEKPSEILVGYFSKFIEFVQKDEHGA